MYLTLLSIHQMKGNFVKTFGWQHGCIFISLTADRPRCARVVPILPANAGQRRPRGNEKGWTECVAENRSRVLGITGDWSTTALLDPGAWYNTVCEGGAGSLPCVGERRGKCVQKSADEENAGDPDNVEAAPPVGVTVWSLRCFRAALIGPTRDLSKRC